VRQGRAGSWLGGSGASGDEGESWEWSVGRRRGREEPGVVGGPLARQRSTVSARRPQAKQGGVWRGQWGQWATGKAERSWE
jgi:hypothetical protein